MKDDKPEEKKPDPKVVNTKSAAAWIRVTNTKGEKRD